MRGSNAAMAAAVVLVVGAMFVAVQLHTPAGSVELAQSAAAAAAPNKASAAPDFQAPAKQKPGAHKQKELAAQVHGARSANRVSAVPAATQRVVRKAKKVISGKAIFARMVKVLGKVAKAQRAKKTKPAPKPPADMPETHDVATKAFKQALTLQSLAAEVVNEDGEIDVNDDPPAQTVYVYRGRETKTKTDELVTFILAGGFGIPDIKYIESSSDADMRKALWDEDCRAVIFPPLKDMPDFGPNAVKDMRAYVSHGMHHSGTMLFMGSSVEVHIINDVFGYMLEQDFKPGSP